MVVDVPVMVKAGLYGEELYRDSDGHQPITGVFTGEE